MQVQGEEVKSPLAKKVSSVEPVEKAKIWGLGLAFSRRSWGLVTLQHKKKRRK